MKHKMSLWRLSIILEPPDFSSLDSYDDTHTQRKRAEEAYVASMMASSLSASNEDEDFYYDDSKSVILVEEADRIKLSATANSGVFDDDGEYILGDFYDNSNDGFIDNSNDGFKDNEDGDRRTEEKFFVVHNMRKVFNDNVYWRTGEKKLEVHRPCIVSIIWRDLTKLLDVMTQYLKLYGKNIIVFSVNGMWSINSWCGYDNHSIYWKSKTSAIFASVFERVFSHCNNLIGLFVDWHILPDYIHDIDVQQILKKSVECPFLRDIYFHHPSPFFTSEENVRVFGECQHERFGENGVRELIVHAENMDVCFDHDHHTVAILRDMEIKKQFRVTVSNNAVLHIITPQYLQDTLG